MVFSVIGVVKLNCHVPFCAGLSVGTVAFFPLSTVCVPNTFPLYINVTVNGKTTKINGNKQYTWGGPDAEIGYYQDTEGELDVSISGSGSFTIWGLGLIK